MFFVSGITGKVGGAVADHLLREGRAFRALTRNPAKASAWATRGVDVRLGDFGDPSAMTMALESVESAFLMLPPVLSHSPGFPEATDIISSFTAALRRTPLPRLVVLSSIGSQQQSGIGVITATRLLEEALAELPISTAIVRAGCFLENFTVGLRRAASTGWFDSFPQPTDKPVPMVATADIGHEVAKLMLGGWTGKRTIELGSPVSPDDLARAMSKLSGRTVRARPIPREQWATRFESSGVPRGTTRAHEEIWDGFNSGWITFGVPGAEQVPGKLTPAQVFARACGAPSG
jgi:uncharacterized protein YbjT (DUF2867 family)